MLKPVAMSMLILGPVLGGAMAAETSDQPVLGSPHADSAVQRAKQLLAKQLGAAEDGIEIKNVQPQTWNDSSLGCNKPGLAALQVITEGYAVTAAVQGKEYRVHVAGDQAIVCDRPVLMRTEPKRSTMGRGLDVALTQARADLAGHLGIEEPRIRTQGVQPVQWQDSGMECPVVGQPVKTGPVNGYKIQLQYAGRTYTYHTDLSVVRACPPIEEK